MHVINKVNTVIIFILFFIALGQNKNNSYMDLSETIYVLKTNACEALIEWGRSDQTSIPPEVKSACRGYYSACACDKGNSRDDVIARNEIAARGLIISCIHALNKEQLLKVEKAVLVTAKQSL